MTTDRCPACNAAVTPGAPWCTLCYADLRPRLVEEPAPVAELAIAASLPSRAGTRRLLSADEEPGWPCHACGSHVPLADNACPQCGSPFLPPEAAPSLHLPGVGDVARLEKGQRIALMIGGMVAITAVFMVLAFLLGSVL